MTHSQTEPQTPTMTAMTATTASTSRDGNDARRKRFSRREEAGVPTPVQMDVLQLLRDNRFLSTAQVALVMGWSDKTAREHLRRLYDLKAADRMAVPGNLVGTRALLADNVHFPTRAGLKLLADFTGEWANLRPAELTPSGYLGHELAVRDVLAWLAASARSSGHRLETWDCARRIDVGGVLADAVFAYRRGESGPGSVVAGFVEADRGTQTTTGSAGGKNDRWAAKIAAYSALFQPEGKERRKQLTGYAHGVLLVTVPDGKRADWVLARVAGMPMAPYTLVGVQSELIPPPPKRESGKPAGKRPTTPDAAQAVWRMTAGDGGKRVALVAPPSEGVR